MIQFQTLMLEPEIFHVEVTVGDSMQSVQIRAIPLLAQEEFKTLVLQFAQDSRPCKLKFWQLDRVWSQCDHRFKEIERSLEFRNNAWEVNENERVSANYATA